jgi:hypothetical protein
VFCLFIIIILSTTGCTSLNFIASGRTPFKIAANPNSEKTVEIEGTSDFFFWGMSPGRSNIDLEDHGNRLGLNLPSYVSIYQTTTWKSVFYTIVTFGLYCPADYKIVVLTSKQDMK